MLVLESGVDCFKMCRVREDAAEEHVGVVLAVDRLVDFSASPCLRQTQTDSLPRPRCLFLQERRRTRCLSRHEEVQAGAAAGRGDDLRRSQPDRLRPPHGLRRRAHGGRHGLQGERGVATQDGLECLVSVVIVCEHSRWLGRYSCGRAAL